MMLQPRRQGQDWRLDDAEDLHRQNPRSFFIPSQQARESLQTHDVVRLRFVLTAREDGQPEAERMWLRVTAVGHNGYAGTLGNSPTAIRDLAPGDAIAFGPRHVIAILDEAWERYADLVAFVNRRLLEDDELEPSVVVHDPADGERPPRSDGSRASGWQLLVGDETDEELSDPGGVVTPYLDWLMDRYPPFGTLVLSGASDGAWRLAEDGTSYERA